MGIWTYIKGHARIPKGSGFSMKHSMDEVFCAKLGECHYTHLDRVELSDSYLEYFECRVRDDVEAAADGFKILYPILVKNRVHCDLEINTRFYC